jgi:vacuolar-type H+-ATPase subunit I/STV1
MKRSFEYVIKVDGKEVWRGLNPAKAYFEIKKKYPKKEVSSLKEEISKKILELDKLSDEVRGKIETWYKRMEKVLEVSKVTIDFSKKVKSLEESIKRLEERQKELIKLLEAVI